jgi:hypothetical protein
MYIKSTYKNQSIGITSVTSSTGKPTAVNTIAIVTKPAEGIPAAPIAAAVDVKLKEKNKTNTQYGDRSPFYSPWFLKIKTTYHSNTSSIVKCSCIIFSVINYFTY